MGRHGPRRLRSIARKARAVAAKCEHDKRTKYATLLGEYSLVPFVIDTAGIWGEADLKLVKDIGARLTAKTGETRAAAFIRQRVAVEMQRGNARMISGGMPPSDVLRELSFLRG